MDVPRWWTRKCGSTTDGTHVFPFVFFFFPFFFFFCFFFVRLHTLASQVGSWKLQKKESQLQGKQLGVIGQNAERIQARHTECSGSFKCDAQFPFYIARWCGGERHLATSKQRTLTWSSPCFAAVSDLFRPCRAPYMRSLSLQWRRTGIQCRSSSSWMKYSVLMARFNTDVKATSNSRPASFIIWNEENHLLWDPQGSCEFHQYKLLHSAVYWSNTTTPVRRRELSEPHQTFCQVWTVWFIPRFPGDNLSNGDFDTEKLQWRQTWANFRILWGVRWVETSFLLLPKLHKRISSHARVRSVRPMPLSQAGLAETHASSEPWIRIHLGALSCTTRGPCNFCNKDISSQETRHIHAVDHVERFAGFLW